MQKFKRNFFFLRGYTILLSKAIVLLRFGLRRITFTFTVILKRGVRLGDKLYVTVVGDLRPLFTLQTILMFRMGRLLPSTGTPRPFGKSDPGGTFMLPWVITSLPQNDAVMIFLVFSFLK